LQSAYYKNIIIQLIDLYYFIQEYNFVTLQSAYYKNIIIQLIVLYIISIQEHNSVTR